MANKQNVTCKSNIFNIKILLFDDTSKVTWLYVYLDNNKVTWLYRYLGAQRT